MKALPTSDVLDLREDAAVCAVPLRLLGRRRVIAGRIRTVRCLEDNALVKALLGTQSAGEVLVIDGGGSLRTALLGDMIAAAGVANGWAGVIVFGAVRDSGALDALDFQVKCLGTMPRKSAKAGTGAVDVEVEVGGVRFVPGHGVYSDPDGIVVVAEPLV